ncbi:MAG TPA: L-rhamnose isomerase [bacterium]|nr:L-rhamnose isomerase [bacterium]
MTKNPESVFMASRETYERLGVDVVKALSRLESVSLSLPCWQGDDVRGFESPDRGPDGGIAVTGSYPGRARNGPELRADLEKALSLLPGRHRVNLHAMYAEFTGRPADRDRLRPEHFSGWMDWARSHSLGLDFNATCFSHPKADEGWTLSHADPAIRAFWIEHVRRCRQISRILGRETGSSCIHNLWIPDGSRDQLADRFRPRERLISSLDAIYEKSFPPDEMKDSVESKLFGIGSEAFVAGSYDLYLAYALKRNLMICLDMGHFHPTESVADKVSALLPFFPEILFHLSRGLRWDSDHVVILDDALLELCREIVRAGALERIHLALDYFDATIHRVAAWVIGARAVMKALLRALLEPRDRLMELEESGDLTGRLALMETVKALPWGAVWNYHCEKHEVPPDETMMNEIRVYEQKVTSRRQ